MSLIDFGAFVLSVFVVLSIFFTFLFMLYLAHGIIKKYGIKHCLFRIVTSIIIPAIASLLAIEIFY